MRFCQVTSRDFAVNYTAGCVPFSKYILTYVGISTFMELRNEKGQSSRVSSTSSTHLSPPTGPLARLRILLMAGRVGIEDGHQRPNCCCVAKLALADHDTPDEMHFHERSALVTGHQLSTVQLRSAACCTQTFQSD